MVRDARLLVVSLVLLSAGMPCAAWPPMLENWRELLEEADVIVIGNIVGDVERVAHARPPGSGRSWEHRARLAIDEVLRGQCAEAEIRIVLHYGLVTSRYLEDGQAKTYEIGPKRDDDKLVLWSTNEGYTMLEDAREPAIWLLGRYPDRFGRGDKPTAELGGRDRFHVQPIELRPLLQSILDHEPLERQLAFLDDADKRVRHACLRYLMDNELWGAFPAVTGLFSDEDARIVRLAIDASVALGGNAAVEHLRPLLDDPRAWVAQKAAAALGGVSDPRAVSALVRVLRTGETPEARSAAAVSLGRMKDVSVVPALIDALKDDGLRSASQREVWQDARDALRELTHCRLSPNSDKAAQWWRQAKDLDEEAWKHFAASHLVKGLLRLSPSARREAVHELRALGFAPPDPGDWLRLGNDQGYDPIGVRATWRRWLDAQGWEDYKALPSQADDEIGLIVELTSHPDGDEPVRLRYTLISFTDRDLWLTRHWDELPIGPGGSISARAHRGPKELSADDFFRLPAGEQRAIEGKAVVYDRSRARGAAKPAFIIGGLQFRRKGTSLGLDAWVGELWSQRVEMGE